MEAFLITSFTVLGLIVGSFLGVIIFRLNTGKSFGGRSICMSCGKKLTVLELVPIFSFILLGGKCKVCRSNISRQYFFIELITAIIFVALYFKFKNFLYINPNSFIIAYSYYSVLLAILVIIAFYDFRHKIIPNCLSLTLGLLSFASLFLFDNFVFSPHIPNFDIEILSGLIIASPLAAAFFASKGNWIGFGDVKLEIGLGYLVGLYKAFVGMVLSFWIGAIVSLGLIYAKKCSMKSVIPFAPFLILGAILSFFLEINLIPGI